jgi:hypothetical protein
MRKRFRVLLLAAIVAAFIVPVGFALSLESGAATPHVRYGAGVGAPAAHTLAVTAPVAHAVVYRPVAPVAGPSSQRPLPGVPEGAKLFALGTALFGLAAVVRRAV